MDQEFALAKKRQEKERAKLLEERRAKAERERRGRAEFERAEANRLEQLKLRNEQQILLQQRHEQEALNSGGIHFAEFLRPVPFAELETDRIRLPASVLQKLSMLGAIRDNSILAFELCLFDTQGNEILAKTHGGVLEFTAQEGTVEIPVKVAMSLTHYLVGGEAMLVTNKLRVRLVQIDHSPKVKVRIQPKGEGFHLNDKEVVSLDLKSVLERVLRQQTAISLGDCIPLRHESRTFVLNVKDLWPDSPALLINTDLEVDMMPCENVELKEIEEKRLREEQIAWRARAADLATKLANEPTTTGGSRVVAFKARLPGVPVAHARKFDKDTTTVQQVFDWAASLLGETSPNFNDELEIVLGPGSSLTASNNKLENAGLGHAQVLNFRWKQSGVSAPAVETTPPPTAPPSTTPTLSEEWVASRINAESHLDKDLENAMMEVENAEEEEEGLSRVDMFKLLVSLGAERTKAATVSQKYHACLLAIYRLGLFDNNTGGQLVVDLVDKYKGSTSRVADAIVQAQASPAPSPAPSPALDWTDKIQVLQNMFTDKAPEEILHALHKHKGSVERAANELLLLS